MATAADMATLQKNIDRYLAVPVLNAKQKAALKVDLASLTRDLKALVLLRAAAVTASGNSDPNLVPTLADGQQGTIQGGKLISLAADMDAESIADVNAGNPPLAEAAKYAGQALKEKVNLVISSTGAANSLDIVFTTFHDGAVAGIDHGNSSTDTGALAHKYGLPA